MTLFIIISALIIAFFIITYICYRTAFYVGPKANRDPHVLLPGEQYQSLKDRIVPLIEGAVALPYTDMYIKSFDGLRLHGYFYQVKKNAPIEIMFHGYKSIALRDFCGALQFTLKRGHNVLLVDQRSHGKSEGKCLTFGVKERYDCLSWVNFVNERFGNDTKIILVGVSMGAATVLMASDIGLPENVVGIVADSSYSSPKAIIKKVIKDMKLPVSLSYPFAYLGGLIFAHFDLNSSTALKSVSASKIPTLFFHGEADTFVPCEMGHELYEACKAEKELVTVKGSDHGLEYMIDENAYMAALERFHAKID